MIAKFSVAFLLLVVSFAHARASDPVRTLPTPGDVKWLAITPDSKCVITANALDRVVDSESCELRVWEISTGKLLLGPVKTNGAIANGILSPDGKRLVTGDYESRWRLWDMSELKPLETGTLGRGRVDRIAFSPDGKQVFALTANYHKRLFDPIKASRVTYRLHTIDTATGKTVGESAIWPRALAAGQTADEPNVGDPADWTVAVGPALDREGRPVIPTGRAVRILEYPGETCGGVMAFALSPDRKLAACAGCNGSVVLWDYPNRAVIGKPLPVGGAGPYAVHLAFSADGTRIAVACKDGREWGGNEISIVDVKSREIVAGPFTTGMLGVGAIERMAFTPDGTAIAAAVIRRGGPIEKADSGVLIWSLPGRK